MKVLPLLAVIAVLSTTGAHAAKERMFIDEPEPPTSSRVQDSEKWRELDVTLPAWPDDADLVEFELDDASSPFRHYIDSKNLAVGKDGVVRYTVVLESGSGARNVSFEGLRCTPHGEYKVYAYGMDRSFRPAAENDWRPVPSRGDQLHQELHGHFLCIPRKFAPRPKQDMIRALQGPINPRQNTGFMAD